MAKIVKIKQKTWKKEKKLMVFLLFIAYNSFFYSKLNHFGSTFVLRSLNLSSSFSHDNRRYNVYSIFMPPSGRVSKGINLTFDVVWVTHGQFLRSQPAKALMKEKSPSMNSWSFCCPINHPRIWSKSFSSLAS